MQNQIYFIDSKLNDYQAIINSLSSTDLYYIIDSTKDGLEQISNNLLNYSNLDSIHIYSHGSIGSLNIGNMIYDNTNISDYKIELENIGKSLSSTGDILLYGCNVGQDELGLNFINQIAQFTQADVASSNDLTGNRVLGGDWDLEVVSGVVETEAKMIVNYELTLGITNATPLTNGKTVSFDSSSSDNYYSFTLNSAGNILVSGSDGYGYSIDTVKIYNSNFAQVGSNFSVDGSTSTSLSAGIYYIQPIDSWGGSFSVSSNQMSGSTMSATPLTNGKTVSFDSSSSDNYYSFTLNSAGNILVSGSDGYGYSIDTVKIYNSNFAQVGSNFSVDGSTSTSLSAGIYYIQPIDSWGGSFSVSSNQMS
ncbi:DUF4347 domain-containing protein, partial [Aliarcobacter butzleri]|uniref:DUF4347 domain-containing protein n=1 Tax=Aliarcobacter butzleri TaxID=28197 RepID=UPI0021B27FF7